MVDKKKDTNIVVYFLQGNRGTWHYKWKLGCKVNLVANHFLLLLLRDFLSTWIVNASAAQSLVYNRSLWIKSKHNRSWTAITNGQISEAWKIFDLYVCSLDHDHDSTPTDSISLVLKTGLITQANGSAYIEAGNTKVVCAV